jgi:DNA primase
MVAFGGRILDDSLPKYINSPESAVYHKGRTLYGLFRARDTMRQTGEALVVEGYFDVLALQRAGFETAVATCGTAMTPDHARLLKRYAEQVLLVFDEDAAGRQATFRAMDVLLPEGLTVKVVSLAAGDDPDSLIKAQGAAAFQACLDKAQPVIEVFLQDQLKIHGESVEGRARAAQEVMTRIRRLPDDLTRNLYVKRLAELTGLDEALLQQKSQQTISREIGATRTSRVPVQRPVAPVQPVQRPTASSRSQSFLLKLMTLEDGRWRSRVREEGVSGLFLDECYRGVADHLLQQETDDGQLPDNLSVDGLDEQQQAVMTGLLLSDDKSWADEAEQIFSGCQRAVKQTVLKAQLEALNRREKAAHHDGDHAVVEQCMHERLKINAEIKKKH